MAQHTLEVSAERAALMRAQRAKITVQTSRLRAELVPKLLIGEVWARLIGNFRARVLGVGTKVAGPIQAGRNDLAVIRDIVDAEIAEALEELSSEGNFERFMGELERVPEPRPDGDEDAEASAEAVDIGVGRRKSKAKRGVRGRAGALDHGKGGVSAGDHGRDERPGVPVGRRDDVGTDRED